MLLTVEVDKQQLLLVCVWQWSETRMLQSSSTCPVPIRLTTTPQLLPLFTQWLPLIKTLLVTFINWYRDWYIVYKVWIVDTIFSLQGVFGQLTYSLTGDGDATSVFFINPGSGAITLQQSLFFQTSTVYTVIWYFFRIVNIDDLLIIHWMMLNFNMLFPVVASTSSGWWQSKKRSY